MNATVSTPMSRACRITENQSSCDMEP
jgi:hypothetical protein